MNATDSGVALTGFVARAWCGRDRLSCPLAVLGTRNSGRLHSAVTTAESMVDRVVFSSATRRKRCWPASGSSPKLSLRNVKTVEALVAVAFGPKVKVAVPLSFSAHRERPSGP